MQHLQPNTTLQGGKYRIERVLGQGGFGNTYVGYNTEFEETVAIKEFFMKGVTERDETTCVVSVSNADNVQQFEEQREKFKKEARRLRKLKNEHIVKVHDLFESRIYLITDKNDKLAAKNSVREEDLYGRTLMVGGGSPAALKVIQHRMISSGKIQYFNSPDHDTTLTNVAAGRGICLAPGFLNDHSGQFAWIPFECEETFSCVLCTHKADSRTSLSSFIEIMKKLYRDAVAFPL